MLLGLPEFEMVSAASIAEARALLSRHGEGACLFAGGTDLLVKMKHRRIVPRTLIDIKNIPGLDRISHDQEGLHIGALATIQAIRDSVLVKKKCPVLRQAASVMGTTQVRNLGTLGGNLANASPSAEFAPPLMILGARVRSIGDDGERLIPVEEFFLAPGKSALRHDEILTEVIVPDASPAARAIYLKQALRRMDVAIASAAVQLLMEGNECREARIVLGAVAPTPLRADRAEQALQGRSPDPGLLAEAARLAAEQSRPIDDIRAYAAYRSNVVAKLVEQALQQLLGQAAT